jgi:HAD superfamily hydrolase (TIGR01549 family)
MKAAFLFDIDGTLVDFRFDVTGTRLAMIREIERLGFDTGGLTLTTPTHDIIQRVRDQISAGVVMADFASVRRRLYEILDTFEERTSILVSPLPGVVETLEYLKGAGARLAVLTNSGRKSADSVLGRTGLARFFEFVLTRDEVNEMKPSGAGIEMALSIFSLPPERVCYVGDSVYDITAARAAGVTCVSVATGSYRAEILAEAGAEVVIRSLPELLPTMRL